MKNILPKAFFKLNPDLLPDAGPLQYSILEYISFI
jgi:hypothetical protein